MVTLGAGPYDLTLQDRRVDPTKVLGLVLYRGGANEGVSWSESRVPPLSPRRSSGELSFTHRDPTYDLVFSQTSWADGALQAYYTTSDPRRYASSHNMDLRWDGVASLGPPLTEPRDCRVRLNWCCPNGQRP